MAGISIVERSSLVYGRLGAEFYHPSKLESLKKIGRRASLTISDCFSVVKKTVSPKQAVVEDALVFDLTDASAGLMDEGQKINDLADLGSTKKQFQFGDVLISRLRPYLREVCLVSKGNSHLLGSTEFIVLRQIDKVLPEYLTAFLLTSEIQNILFWSQEGTNHPRFPGEVLLDLPIPQLSNAEQKRIAKFVQEAIEQKGASRSLYLQAQQAVLDRVDFSKLELPHTLFYSISLSEAKSKGRIDAEHFQPKYERLLKHLKSRGGVKSLGELVKEPIHRGVQPKYVENGDVIALNSRYVGLQFIDVENAERTNEEFWSYNKRAQAYHLNVVMNSTGWGTIGRTNCVLHGEKTIVDNHVSIIQPDHSVCDPIYLAVYLNSEIGLMQTNQWLTGSSGQVELYPNAISSFKIFLPEQDFQREIADLVKQAFAARQKAKSLIAEAIQTVEDFIEKPVRKTKTEKSKS